MGNRKRVSVEVGLGSEKERVQFVKRGSLTEMLKLSELLEEPLWMCVEIVKGLGDA